MNATRIKALKIVELGKVEEKIVLDSVIDETCREKALEQADLNTKDKH